MSTGLTSLLVVASVLAQSAGSGDGLAWLAYLGPFLPFGVLAMWVIVRQAKQIGEKDARIDILTDRAVEQQAVLGPVLNEATRVLTDAVTALDRERRRE